MKFAVMTKHLHLVVSYRHPDEEESTFVDNTGGDFDPARNEEVDVAPEDGVMHFGFLRA